MNNQKGKDIRTEIGQVNMTEKSKEDIEKIFKKEGFSNNDLIQVYTMVEADPVISQPERYKLFRFFEDHFFDIFTKDIEKESAKQLDEETKLFLKVSGESSILAYYRLMIICESKKYFDLDWIGEDGKRTSYLTAKEYIENVFGISEQTAYKYFAAIKNYGLATLRVFSGGWTKLFPALPFFNEDTKIPEEKKEDIKMLFIEELKKNATAREIEQKAKNIKKNIDKINEYTIEDIADNNIDFEKTKKVSKKTLDGWEKFISVDGKKKTKAQIEADKIFKNEMEERKKELKKEIYDNSEDWKVLYEKLFYKIKPPTTKEGKDSMKKIFLNFYHYYESTGDLERILNKLK